VNRIQRIAWAAAVVASSVLTIRALTALGSESRGPLSAVLAHAGTSVAGLEGRVVRRLRGPGRAAGLRWFEPYRADPARLRDPGAVLLGAYDGAVPGTLQGVLELEKALGVALPLMQLYAAWGDRPEQRFPLRTATAVWELGSVPVITWEPWLTDFESRLHPELPLRQQRDRGGLAAIARGDYDFYVDEWAAEAAEFGKPLFLRFGHEMNDPYRYSWGPQNNRPEDFVAAWRHLVERFRAAGAHNVVWVWSPHVAYAGWESFYPGDDVVDWVATGALNYGSVAHWSRWWSFADIFGRHYESLAALGKPIMVAEFGTLAVGGDRAAWFRDALADFPVRHPAVKALLFFHVAGDATVTYQRLDWSIAGDSAMARTVSESLRPWAPGGAAR
jgi:hypothetical protein